MKRLHVGIMILSIVVLMASCGLDDSGEWKKLGGDDITLKGDLEKPTILWDGEAVNLIVYDEDNDNVMWQIGESQYTGVQTFFSPVVYGEVPDGVNQQFSPLDLEEGVTYQIGINLKDGTYLSAEFKFE